MKLFFRGMLMAAMVAALGRFLFAGEATASPSTNAPLREVAPGIFQMGTVRLDKNKRTVECPAQLNMREGIVEYLLVTSKGKTHESLLKTDAEPYQIHTALLLLGAKGAPVLPDLLSVPSSQYHANKPGASNPIIMNLMRGDRIGIELRWQEAGREVRVPAEDCLLNLQTKTNASAGPWSYNGSRVINGVFIAQREGSMVAMVDDVDAMANNPRPGHDNDQIWQIKTNGLPMLNSVVQVIFKLE